MTYMGYAPTKRPRKMIRYGDNVIEDACVICKILIAEKYVPCPIFETAIWLQNHPKIKSHREAADALKARNDNTP